MGLDRIKHSATKIGSHSDAVNNLSELPVGKRFVSAGGVIVDGALAESAAETAADQAAGAEHSYHR
jgi:hypothetical protein